MDDVFLHVDDQLHGGARLHGNFCRKRQSVQESALALGPAHDDIREGRAAGEGALIELAHKQKRWIATSGEADMMMGWCCC